MVTVTNLAYVTIAIKLMAKMKFLNRMLIFTNFFPWNFNYLLRNFNVVKVTWNFELHNSLPIQIHSFNYRDQIWVVVVFHNSTGLQLKVHGFVSIVTYSICSESEFFGLFFLSIDTNLEKSYILVVARLVWRHPVMTFSVMIDQFNVEKWREALPRYCYSMVNILTALKRFVMLHVRYIL